jgi:hypothetical protein
VTAAEESMNEIVPIEESPEAVLGEVRMASEAFGAAREGSISWPMRKRGSSET